MPLLLLKPVADYFAASSTDARCFTADAVVIDERREHRGREAIRRWMSEAVAKYDYVSEPVAVDERADGIVVTARVTGNFPGSPVDLRYAFTLSGDAIARLEIVP